MIRGAAGFTLLEVMVAFIIAALALGALYEGAVGGLRNTQIAGSYEEALSLARSHLAELSARNAQRPYETEGEDGPQFHYAVRVAVVAAVPLARSLLEQANNRPARTATLYGLTVTESWHDGAKMRHVDLRGEALSVSAPAS